MSVLYVFYIQWEELSLNSSQMYAQRLVKTFDVYVQVFMQQLTVEQ